MPDGFLDRLAHAPIVCDGAMGTMLYEKGVYINRCYDEVNLTQPDLATPGPGAEQVPAPDATFLQPAPNLEPKPEPTNG